MLNIVLNKIQKVAINIIHHRYYSYYRLFFPILLMIIFKGSYQIMDCLESETHTSSVNNNNHQDKVETKNSIFGSFLFLSSIGLWFYFFGGIDGSTFMSILEYFSFINGVESTSGYDTGSEFSSSSNTENCLRNNSYNLINESLSKGYPEEKNSVSPNAILDSDKELILSLNKSIADVGFQEMVLFHNPEQCSFYTEMEKDYLLKDVQSFQKMVIDHHIKEKFNNDIISDQDRIGICIDLTEDFMKHNELRRQLLCYFCTKYPESAKIVNSHTFEIAELIDFIPIK